MLELDPVCLESRVRQDFAGEAGATDGELPELDRGRQRPPGLWEVGSEGKGPQASQQQAALPWPRDSQTGAHEPLAQPRPEPLTTVATSVRWRLLLQLVDSLWFLGESALSPHS